MKRIYYKKGYKYQLVDNYRDYIDIYNYSIKTEYIELNKVGRIIIKKGYAWDGASGPTFDTKNAMRPSLIHDASFQLFRMGKLPQSLIKKINDILYKHLREDGMSWVRAKLWIKGVSIFANYAANPKNIKKEYSAPI